MTADVGLLMRGRWLDRVLWHEKVWEIRAWKTDKVGQRVWLVDSDDVCGEWIVRGSAVIADVFELDPVLWEAGRPLHGVPGPLAAARGRRGRAYAWSLTLVEPCRAPRRVPKVWGCVTWAPLLSCRCARRGACARCAVRVA